MDGRLSGFVRNRQYLVPFVRPDTSSAAKKSYDHFEHPRPDRALKKWRASLAEPV
jgi:hypothetical protein